MIGKDKVKCRKFGLLAVLALLACMMLAPQMSFAEQPDSGERQGSLPAGEGIMGEAPGGVDSEGSQPADPSASAGAEGSPSESPDSPDAPQGADPSPEGEAPQAGAGDGGAADPSQGAGAQAPEAGAQPGQPSEGDDPGATVAAAASPSVSYRSHVTNTGWKAYASNGGSSGGIKAGQNVEAVRVKVSGIDGGVTYRVYAKGIGWQAARSDASTAGTTGKALPIQAFKARLTGAAAGLYDLYYRVYVRGIGWLGWTSGFEAAGTTGFDRPLQGLQMRLVRKGDAAPSQSGSVVSAAYVDAPKVSVSAHVQNIGWQKAVGNKKTAGTTGKGLRVEALKSSVSEPGLSGGISTRAHVQNVGWKAWAGNGKVAGTTGRGLRVEALQMKLTGDLAKIYDLSYRAHVQNVGWTSWAKAGSTAGTTGRGLRVEAIQVKLTLKNAASAATPSTKPVSPSAPVSDPKQIMGESQATAAEVAAWYKSTYGAKAYPSAALSKGGAASIEEFVNIVFEEAKAEGVRADVVFAQMMYETGHLNYGGQVKVEQFNYCGLKNAAGTGFQSFANVRTGIRAHVQHLKAYASTASLNKACVDPRFKYVTRGVAPTLDGLSGRWSGESDYGDCVYERLKSILSY